MSKPMSVLCMARLLKQQFLIGASPSYPILIAQADEDSRLAQERLDRVDAARMTPESSERLEAVPRLGQTGGRCCF